MPSLAGTPSPFTLTYVFFFEQCQGVEGHNGHHWCYGPDGSYHWQKNDNDPESNEKEAVAGSIPPDHKLYVSPKKKVKEHYLNFYEDTVVTDKKKIERLERGDTRPGENIDRPVSPKSGKG